MPFLYQIGSSATGFILSCFILLIVTIISFYDSIPDMQFLFLLIALFLIGLLLYCWWRFRITRDYREKLRQAGQVQVGSMGLSSSLYFSFLMLMAPSQV